MVKLLKTNPCIGYAIVVSIMLGIIAVIFIMDINPLRKQIKHEEVVQASKITTETTEVSSEVTGKMEDIRDVVCFLNNTLKSLEKERVMQSIPELPELGKQFEKTINSWGTRTDSVDSDQSTGAK